MSRLAAALQRAATGVVAPRERRIDDVVYDEPTQQVDEPVVTDAPDESGGGEPYSLRELNQDYVDVADTFDTPPRVEASPVYPNNIGDESPQTADPDPQARPRAFAPFGIAPAWSPTADPGSAVGCRECVTLRRPPPSRPWVHRMLCLARIRRSHCGSCGRGLYGHAIRVGARASMTIEAKPVGAPNFLRPEDGRTFSELIRDLARDERAQHADDVDSRSAHRSERLQQESGGALADGQWRSVEPPTRPNRPSIS